MAAFPFELTIYIGTTFQQTFAWVDTETGEPVNLDGWRGMAQIRDASGTILVEFSTADGSIVLGGSSGAITLQLDTATVDIEPFRNARWDLLLKDPDGVIHPPLLEGRAQALATVTIWP